MRERVEDRFKIAVHPLSVGEHHLQFDVAPTAVELEEGLFSQIEVDVRLDVGVSRILVHFEARAIARLECDRTLMPFDEPVSGSHTVLFTADSKEEADANMHEWMPFSPNSPTIDITVPVRDTLMLAVPLKKVAPEAIDLEIPTTFGETDSPNETDPRWQALKKLKISNN